MRQSLVFCLFCECAKQVNFPGDAEVGLEHADAVHAGVRAAEVQAQATVANGIELEAETFEVDPFLWGVVGVIDADVVECYEKIWNIYYGFYLRFGTVASHDRMGATHDPISSERAYMV